MPLIHILGSPTDLYRYETFVSTVLNRKNIWGITLNYLPQNSAKKSFLHAKCDSLLRLIKTLKYIAKADYIYIPPMTIGLGLTDKILILFCNIFRKKIIFEFYISLYDTLVLDRKKYTDCDREAKVCKSLDNWGHHCYKTLYLNPCEAKRYRKLNDLQIEHNTRIIPLSIKFRAIAELNYYKLGNSNTFNMVWWGTYIPLHGLDKIIDAIQLLSKNDRSIHLYILGNNPELSKEYSNRVDSIEGLSEIITISNDYTFTNGKLLPFLIHSCDLAFGAFGDSEKAKTVILNKAIEAVAMKIPVLTQYSEAFEDYFKPSETLFYCDNNPSEIAKAILYIKNMNYAQLSERLNTSYEIYNNNFSIEASKKQFGELLDELETEWFAKKNDRIVN